MGGANDRCAKRREDIHIIKSNVAIMGKYPAILLIVLQIQRYEGASNTRQQRRVEGRDICVRALARRPERVGEGSPAAGGSSRAQISNRIKKSRCKYLHPVFNPKTCMKILCF